MVNRKRLLVQSFEVGCHQGPASQNLSQTARNDSMAAKFKVRADVFHYFVMVVVGAGGTYAFTRFYGESDEVKENNLRARYPQQVRKSENQHAQMQEFFNQMKNSDKALDDKMSEVLKGGKGDMKRHHRLEEPVSSPAAPASPPVVAASKKPKVSKSTSEEVTALQNSSTAANGWWNGWGWW